MEFKEWFKNNKIDDKVLNTILIDVDLEEVQKDIKDNLSVKLVTEIMTTLGIKDINTLTKKELVLISFYGSEYGD